MRKSPRRRTTCISISHNDEENNLKNPIWKLVIKALPLPHEQHCYHPLMIKSSSFMKTILGGLLCLSTLVYGQGRSHSVKVAERITSSTAEILSLHQDWEYTQVGAESRQWYSARVPGTIHQDLISHQQLPDPFYGTNEQKIQWVEQSDWCYRTTFTVSEKQLARHGATLTFEGLDTYADVYLNGSHILTADNMFVGYTIPVKNVLREGANFLQILFHSPIKKARPQFETNGFNYPADNDHHDQHLSVFTRKAPYSYGWDWGIRMVTSGIWRPVTLQFYDVATIDDHFVNQRSLTDQRADLANEITLNSCLAEPIDATLRIACTLHGETRSEVTRSVRLEPGLNRIGMPLAIHNPVRWMPNGWGEPTLYDITAELICDQHTVASRHQRIGLRTIRLVNQKDLHGESFYFEVNGKPMFAKGANFIPDDALLPQVTTERYETLFRDIKAANMNLIRVWGGGTYEDNRFYDLADENGILVWQDFMFACTPYPADPAFLKRVEAEADYNIRRLRNHPSLAMWCGNNEILEALKYWGYEKKFTPEVYNGFFADYDRLFRELLPRKVKELDADRFYVHSSPYLANWGRPESWGFGDSHNWGVWYGQKPFESLDTDLPRFMSEFGFQSFPEMKTIATFADPEDYQIESEVMNAHQKSSIGNALIRTYMERDYRLPERFEDFVYVGLVLQGHGMRHGFEAHRRNRPYCMGTLYWQLNDSWPVVSWSSIDYYGNWKALHYQAQRAFAPLLINPLVKGDSLEVHLVSDRLDTLANLTLEMAVIDFNGRIMAKRRLPSLTLAANSSARVYQEMMEGLVTKEQRTRTCLQLTLKDKKGESLAQEIFFFVKTKALDLPQARVKYRVVKQQDGRCEVLLTTDRLAKDLFIELPYQGARFSDNFFDLLPGQPRRIVITSPLIKARTTCPISLKHIRETYQ